MLNDSAMKLAVSAGTDASKVFLSSASFARSLTQIESGVRRQDKTVFDVFRLRDEVTAVKVEVQIVCDAFLIWKGLHRDLVRKYENPDEPGFDPIASLSWFAQLEGFGLLRRSIEKLTVLEYRLLEARV